VKGKMKENHKYKNRRGRNEWIFLEINGRERDM
jgi:hypothetical protein